MRNAQTTMTTVAAAGFSVLALACGADETEQQASASPMAAVTISSPMNGQNVEGSLTIRLETKGVEVRPAGTMEPGTGHHHLFIDRDITPIGEPIPTDDGVVHLGAAQTEYVFENLAPGPHTVIAVMGDHLHIRLADVATDTVTVTIEGT